MSATVSAWGKPGAWALDSEENESELLQAHRQDSSVANGDEKSDFPSLSAAATSKTKKNKPQKLSFQEFSAYSAPKPAAAAAQQKGLTHDELMHLPTGPRERSAEELDRNKLGGGFRSYGGGRDDQPRRQGSFNRDSDREFAPSRADETDDWGAGKKSSANNNVSDRRERGERGGFFSDSQSRADDASNWSSNKSFAPSEPKRYEKRGSFGSESSNGGSDSGNWGKKREEEGRRSGGGGGAFDSLRERRGGSESNGVDSDNWGKKTEEVSGGGTRPRLNLQPRTVAVVNEGEKNEINNAAIVKTKGSSPFGDARPREEVLKEIEEKLESAKVKDVDGEEKTELVVDSHHQSGGETENGSAESTENGNAED